MNSQLHQYPAALYSSVSEIGYRAERYTGESLRSGSDRRRAADRPGIFRRIRHAFVRDGGRRSRRVVVIHPMHGAR
jgi:hypothetical protein